MTKLSRIADMFARATVQVAQDAPAPGNVSKTNKSVLPQPTHTISLRVTDEEKFRLERAAAGMSRSDYMRERLFGETAKPRRTRGKHPVKDYEALGRVLGLLGRSKLAHDLGDMDWAVRNGLVQIDPATAQAIRRACADITAMRDDLVKALGLRPRPAS